MSVNRRVHTTQCFHTRADSRLQWWIVIAIFELLSVYTRERRVCRVCGLAFQSGEKKRGSFLCSSDMMIAISFEIEFLLENVRFTCICRSS